MDSRALKLLLGLLALWDLRIDLQLLLQHLTWTSLVAMVSAHPLAVAVLLLLPSIGRRGRR
jgi:hypothetical protein